MKTIKIAYMDFWPGFEPNSCIFNKILSKYYNIEISEKPDYVFCSLYSFDCLKSDAVRIFYTGDNYTPDFNIYDYALAFDYITFNDRYLRVPNYFINLKYEKAVDLMLHKHENVTDKDFDERKFCSWVCSNGNGNPLRERLFNYISTYNIVDSGGRFLNNIGKPNGVDDKIKFQNNNYQQYDKNKFTTFYTTHSNATLAFKLYDNPENDILGEIIYDVNGQTGPNIWGKDVFGYNITNNGFEPYGKNLPQNVQKQDCSNEGTGISCSNYYLIGGNFD